MKIKKLLFSLVACTLLSASVFAQQPFSVAWHTTQARAFDPADPGKTDPDWKFNLPSVALQPRFIDKSIKANVQQFWDSQVANCLTWHMSCGTVPSQDALNFVGYNYNYWPYLDLNIWWGGSAGEGIILPPSAPVIDASHLNGVKVLGQVFFPPTAYGGNTAWTNEFLETDASGEAIFAKQLVKIARFYGFDGWFINEETKVAMGGGDNAKWENWVNTFNQYKDPHMVLQVYTMQTSVSPITNIWKKDGVSFFVNYNATGSVSSNRDNHAVPNGKNHFEKFYYGLEIGGQGLFQGNAFRDLIGKTENKGSFDLFCPERQLWQPYVDGIRDSDAGTGDVAYAAWESVKAQEGRFYVNINHDVTDLSQYPGYSWPGLATGIAERTSVMNKPFVTSFGVGNGKKRVVNGAVKGVHDWYHRGMQDVLPTWRWWIDGPKTVSGSEENTRIQYHLQPDFTYDDPYNGGSALQLKGKLEANKDNLVRLYKTQLKVESGDKFQLVYKTSVISKSCIDLKLAFREDGNSFTTVSLPAATSTGWTTYQLDLTPYAGKTITIIAFNFKSTTTISNYTTTFGQLSVLPSGFSPVCGNISNLQIENDLKETTGELRITWDKATGDVHHYNVYLTRSGNTELVGQTRNQGFYYPKFERNGQTETDVSVTVIPVKSDLTESGPGLTVVKPFPKIGKPEVSFFASKTVVNTGVEVTFIASATNFPTGYSWEFPQATGAVLVKENAMKDTVVYKFLNEGKVDVTCQATNVVGVAGKTTHGMVEVSNTVEPRKLSCAPNAKIHSSSGAINSTEVEDWIIDCVANGTSTATKWCAGGLYEHWVIIDLQDLYKVCKFVQYDSGVREEASWNHTDYRIYTSVDLENWELIVDQKGRPESIKEDWSRPTAARYIKYMPYSDEERITIRVYEFEVWGMDGELSIEAPGLQTVDIDEVKQVSATYNLGDMQRESNFSVTIVPVENEDVAAIGNVQVNEETKTITADITGLQYGDHKALFEIMIINGEWRAVAQFTVSCQGNWTENYLLNQPVWADNTYGESYPFTLINDGNKEKEQYFRFASNSHQTTLNGMSGHYFIIDLGSNNYYDIHQYKMTFSSASSMYMPRMVSVYTTDDAIEWSSLSTSNANNYDWIPLTSFELDQTQIENQFILQKPDVTRRYVRFDLTGPYNNSNTYLSYFRPVEFEAFGKVHEGSLPAEIRRVFTPIVVDGFNQDIIAEKKPARNYITSYTDDQGWVFYSADLKEEGSFPQNRLFLTSKGVKYGIAPYDKKNAVLLKNSNEEVTLTFDSPQKAIALYLLGTSSDGESTTKVTVNYQDGTKQSETVTQEDWFGLATASTVITGLDRIIAQTAPGYTEDQFDNRMRFRLFGNKIEVDNKAIQSLTFKKTSSSGNPMFFSVTKETEEVSSAIEPPHTLSFNVWPNPVKRGEVLSVEAYGVQRLRLISAQGSLLLQKEVDEEVTRFVVPDLAPGLYFLQLAGENETKTVKVIVR